MGALQRQYLIAFACMGSVLAYLPVFLKARLDSLADVGMIMATTGLAVIFTPAIMTALADTRVQSRSIIATLFGVSSLTCFWQAQSHSFAALLISHTVFAFFFWPVASLQDGLVFAENQRAAGEGRAQTPYHRVRVYGTVGFALPLAALYFLLDAGMGVSVALYLGGGLCILGALNAMTLPRVALGQARRARFNESPNEKVGWASRPSIDKTQGPDIRASWHPTLAAARVLFKGPPMVFCICLFIAHLGNSAYYAFYQLYLTDTVGFADKWVGPITMLGVVLELGVMACVGVLTAKFGLKRLMILGLLLMSVRFLILGVWVEQHVAVWTQILHGSTVVAIYVLPPVYLNMLAGDHFRSSIHGLYAVAVFGPSRIAGNILGGALSDIDLPMMFSIISGTTLLAVIGLTFGMRLPKEDKRDREVRDVPPMLEGD